MCRYAEFAHYYRGAETLNKKCSPRNRKLDFQSSGSGTIDAIGNEKKSESESTYGRLWRKYGDDEKAWR